MSKGTELVMKYSRKCCEWGAYASDDACQDMGTAQKDLLAYITELEARELLK